MNTCYGRCMNTKAAVETVTIEFTHREIQIVRDALAELRHSRRGQLTLAIESEICAVQVRLREADTS